MSDSERLKKKNLLLSYYTSGTVAASGNSELTINSSNYNSSVKTNALSSPSIGTTNTTTDNTSFTSSEFYSNNVANNNQQLQPGSNSNYNAESYANESNSPYDINSTTFEADLFLRKTIKVCNYISLKYFILKNSF